MSISDRLDQIEQREQRRARQDSIFTPAHTDVPDLLAAVRADLDACDREMAEPWSQETDQLARNARDAIATALGEEHP